MREVAGDLGVQEEQLRLRTMAQVSRRPELKPVAWLFLSHAHEDAALARSLAGLLESALGGRVGVFCTSSVRDRIGTDSDMLSGRRLEEALNSRIVNALGVLLLVTPRAVRKDSRWIEYEIATGTRMARSLPGKCSGESSGDSSAPGRQFYLIPCVCESRHLVSQWDQKLWKSIFKEELDQKSSRLLPGVAAPSLAAFPQVLLSTDAASNADELWRLTELLANAGELARPEVLRASWKAWPNSQALWRRRSEA
jgi:hypothetical protein